MRKGSVSGGTGAKRDTLLQQSIKDLNLEGEKQWEHEVAMERERAEGNARVAEKMGASSAEVAKQFAVVVEKMMKDNSDSRAHQAELEERRLLHELQREREAREHQLKMMELMFANRSRSNGDTQQ